MSQTPKSLPLSSSLPRPGAARLSLVPCQEHTLLFDWEKLLPRQPGMGDRRGRGESGEGPLPGTLCPGSCQASSYDSYDH